MKTIIIDIPGEIVTPLERASFEINTRQAVIDRYLEKHMNDTDSSAIDSKPFNHFMSLLAKAEAEFELQKQEVSKQFIPEYLADHMVEWNLDYSTKEMTINILCDCDIPELED